MSLQQESNSLTERLVRNYLRELSNSAVPREILDSARVEGVEKGHKVIVDHPEAGPREYGSQTVPMTPFIRPAAIRLKDAQDTTVSDLVTKDLKEYDKKISALLRP